MDIQQIFTASSAGPQVSAKAPSSGVAMGESADLSGTKPSAPTVRVSPEAVQPAAQPVDANQLQDAVKKVNQVVQALASDLKFTVDDSTGISVVKVVDLSTKEVIRQIPSEEMLSVAKGIDYLQGLLVKEKA